MAKAGFFLVKSFLFAGFLPASGSYFPGRCVSPALVNALRLPSPPQFRSKDASDPTHAPILRHRRKIWQKAGFSLGKCVVFFFADFFPTSVYFPGLCASPAVVNALRLSSLSQLRSKNAADATHAPTLRRRRGRWQKADFSLEKSFPPRLLADFWFLPGALC